MRAEETTTPSSTIESNPGTSSSDTGSSDTGIVDADFSTDITSNTLVNDIKAQPEGSLIKIYYDSHSTLGSDVFSAIQGKDKSIALFDGYVQWLFEGKTIKNPKQIDLKVEISSLKNMTGPNKNWIADLVGNTLTTVLSFANNGDLPGTAMISVHIDDIFPNSKQTSCWVYYFNPTSHELELIAENRAIDENGYLSFNIKHNSYYIITERAVRSLSGTSSSSSSSSGGSYKGPFGGSSSDTTSSSNKSNPRTGAY